MLATGQRVVVPAIGETPMQALEAATLAPQPPPAVGPGEVLVAVKSASVGWVDLIMMAGQYQHAAKPPYTPGLEYAGTVAAVGAGVTVQVGDAVLVDPFLAGPRSLGAYRDGGFATYALAPAAAVIPMPAALSFDQACNLLGNYETAYHCLVTRGRVQAGETVLILGASGAVGLAAVHVAKRLGAKVIAVGRSAERLAIVRAQGADHVLSNLATLRDDVKALGGADVVYDGVGGELSTHALRCLKFGGRFLIVGWAATPGAVNQLPTNLIMMKSIAVLGCPTVISTVNDPSLRPPRLAQVLAWAAAGEIVPHVSHVFPLADFKAAMELKWRGEVIGGCVVQP